ncbi:hypothetical protein EXE43_18370 [Halorubrum sp. SS5]|nr:hypothetical protein EXE43_18370 [Halorubrum sp. SS5]
MAGLRRVVRDRPRGRRLLPRQRVRRRGGDRERRNLGDRRDRVDPRPRRRPRCRHRRVVRRAGPPRRPSLGPVHVGW